MLCRPGTSRSVRLALPGLLAVASLAALVAGCDPTAPEPQPYPVAWSWSEIGQITVSLRYILPITTAHCQTDSVFVTGPGLAQALALDCSEARGAAFGANVDVTLSPPPLPATYHFAATIDGRSTVQTAEITCYQPLPVGIAPPAGDTVASPVTLRWLTAAASGIPYAVYLGATSAPVGVVTDQDSLRLTLTPGTYHWSVSATPVGLADGTSERECGAYWGSGSFTVQ